jgi:hypothetical protein
VTPGTPADQVRFVPSPGSTEGSTLRALSLSELAVAAEGAVKLGTIVVLGFGSPGSYPFDAYGVVLEGALQLISPAGKVLLPIPLTGLFLDGTAIQPLHAKAETLFSRGQYSANLALERPLPTKLYILLITLIPLILAVLLIVVIARRKERDAFSFGALEIAGVGAVLLAILPARQVLVPPGRQPTHVRRLHPRMRDGDDGRVHLRCRRRHYEPPPQKISMGGGRDRAHVDGRSPIRRRQA